MSEFESGLEWFRFSYGSEDILVLVYGHGVVAIYGRCNRGGILCPLILTVVPILANLHYGPYGILHYSDQFKIINALSTVLSELGIQWTEITKNQPV